MKKLIKIVISVIADLLFSAGIFYCLVTGAPDTQIQARIYIVSAFLLALLIPLLICACIWYIGYLHKIMKQKDANLDKSSFLP